MLEKAPKVPENPDKSKEYSSHTFCVAPMMDWSDRHCRYLWRLMSKKTRLYTEMVVTGAIIHGERTRFLAYNESEHPLALQLGGSHPDELAQCAKIAEDWGYDEVNLNCGCPSDRVQKGKIGAVLMKEPKLVAECVAAMAEACSLPITVKHRIGVDNVDEFEHMKNFVEEVSAAGCDTFIVHARKAWLKGLSPKQNREVPPLKYDYVIELKRQFPQHNIIINGGIVTVRHSLALLDDLDGVMIGREAYSNPYFLAHIDEELFGENPALALDRTDVVEAYAEYCKEKICVEGLRLHHMSRHVLGMFSGQANGRRFRRHISHHAAKPGATHQVLLDALEFVR